MKKILRLVLSMEGSGFQVIEDEEIQEHRLIWSKEAHQLMRDFVRAPGSRPEITAVWDPTA